MIAAPIFFLWWNVTASILFGTDLAPGGPIDGRFQNTKGCILKYSSKWFVFLGSSIIQSLCSKLFLRPPVCLHQIYCAVCFFLTKLLYINFILKAIPLKLFFRNLFTVVIRLYYSINGSNSCNQLARRKILVELLERKNHYTITGGTMKNNKISLWDSEK
jgi:hypothetical protein